MVVYYHCKALFQFNTFSDNDKRIRFTDNTETQFKKIKRENQQQTFSTRFSFIRFLSPQTSSILPTEGYRSQNHRYGYFPFPGDNI